MLLQKLPLTTLQDALHLISSKAQVSPASAKQLSFSSTAESASQIIRRAVILPVFLEQSTRKDLLKVAAYNQQNFELPVGMYELSQDDTLDAVHEVLMGEMMVLRPDLIEYSSRFHNARRVVLRLPQARALPVHKIESLVEKAMMSNNWLAVLEVLDYLPAARHLAGSIVQLVAFCELAEYKEGKSKLQAVLVANVPAAAELFPRTATAEAS